MEEKTQPRAFRAIIVGGGLLGLTAAHMFAKTDMDYVVLEQHDDLMPDIGSLLSLIPSTLRILDQLDIFDALTPFLTRIDLSVIMSADDASVLKKERVGDLFETNHGHGVRIVHRPYYVKALYNSLSESAKTRIHVRKRVVRIEVTDEGVSVYCEDGSVEHGSIVIGTDGVHSHVRRIMQSLAAADSNSESNESPTADAEQQQLSPYLTTYRMLFGTIRALPEFEPGANFEGQAQGVSTQIITSESLTWFSLYEKLETPTHARHRWTEADKQEIVRRWGHLYMAPGYTLEDVYRTRCGDAGLISLEEGLVDSWSWRRIVLVGDAVRKVEPHAGLGYNTGISDLVELVNGLKQMTTQKQQPTTADLGILFQAYQTRRMEVTPTVISMSERRARMCAWLTTTDWLMGRFLAVWLPFGRYGINNVLGPVMSRAPVLEWLEEKHLPPTARIAKPYVNYPKKSEEEKLKYAATEGAPLLPTLLTGTIVLATAATVGLRYYQRVGRI